MIRSCIAMLILAIVSLPSLASKEGEPSQEQAAPALTAIHQGTDLHIARDHNGETTIALHTEQGWTVFAPDGTGRVIGGDLDGMEATAAIYGMVSGTMPIFAAPSPHPNPQSPLLQCIAAAIQACQTVGSGKQWGICELTCDPFNVKCRDGAGNCPPSVAPHGVTLFLKAAE